MVLFVWTLQLDEQRIEFSPVLLGRCEFAVFTRLDVLDECQWAVTAARHHDHKLTESKSSNLSRQFSQYPGFGSFSVAFFLGAALRRFASAWPFSLPSSTTPRVSCAFRLAARGGGPCGSSLRAPRMSFMNEEGTL